MGSGPGHALYGYAGVVEEISVPAIGGACSRFCHFIAAPAIAQIDHLGSLSGQVPASRFDRSQHAGFYGDKLAHHTAHGLPYYGFLHLQGGRKLFPFVSGHLVMLFNEDRIAGGTLQHPGLSNGKAGLKDAVHFHSVIQRSGLDGEFVHPNAQVRIFTAHCRNGNGIDEVGLAKDGARILGDNSLVFVADFSADGFRSHIHVGNPLFSLGRTDNSLLYGIGPVHVYKGAFCGRLYPCAGRQKKGKEPDRDTDAHSHANILPFLSRQK